MPFVTTCPFCGQRYNVQSGSAGETVSCMKCGGQFIISETPQGGVRTPNVLPAQGGIVRKRIGGIGWFAKCFQDYATFSGRARREEFWMFTLFNCIFALVTRGIEVASGSDIGADGFFSVLYSLAVLLPGLSVFVRRMHDTNKSGWWFWIGLVPFVGGIVLLVFACTEGTKGANRFGPDPKMGYAA